MTLSESKNGAATEAVELFVNQFLNDSVEPKPCASCGISFQCVAMCDQYKQSLIDQVATIFSRHFCQCSETSTHEEYSSLLVLLREYRQILDVNRAQWSDSPLTCKLENPFIKKLKDVDEFLARA